MKHVVVLADGSPESASAVRFSAAQVAGFGQRLIVLTSYQVPAHDLGARSWVHLQEAESDARERVVSVIGDALDLVDFTHVVSSVPILELVDQHAVNAAMIVIGTRSTGGWRSTLRGSLTNRITGRVSCPVVSIPADREMAAA